jgi:hypothetical protein
MASPPILSPSISPIATPHGLATLLIVCPRHALAETTATRRRESSVLSARFYKGFMLRRRIRPPSRREHAIMDLVANIRNRYWLARLWPLSARVVGSGAILVGCGRFDGWSLSFDDRSAVILSSGRLLMSNVKTLCRTRAWLGVWILVVQQWRAVRRACEFPRRRQAYPSPRPGGRSCLLVRPRPPPGGG